jgi:hypothetical protein
MTLSPAARRILNVGVDPAVAQGSVASSRCTTAQLLYTRFTNMFGPSDSETTIRPCPQVAAAAKAELSAQAKWVIHGAGAIKNRRAEPTGLAQHLHVRSAVRLKIRIKGLNVARNPGRPPL